MLNGGNMHELSVTESILEIALRHGDAAGAATITDLFLVIGELATIVDESVQFYWDIVSQDTPAAGSLLHFRRIPGQLGCRACGHLFTPAAGLCCPVCGGIDIELLAGEEFYLEAIEVARAGEVETATT
ncbi:putative hydrogenase nickel incorporation protein HypA [Candidatus Promineifilum breve]|uniref:Hydrogenase maturation factor HypA n=2 Tax=Candidatus Promineifilum breve TaxID=1806508 RepID=A0A170PF46_9CHLR|nr:putative hydrogenase nickel incorporation protein HypA [Candidatus Promineifilum breve]